MTMNDMNPSNDSDTAPVQSLSAQPLPPRPAPQSAAQSQTPMPQTPQYVQPGPSMQPQYAGQPEAWAQPLPPQDVSRGVPRIVSQGVSQPVPQAAIPAVQPAQYAAQLVYPTYPVQPTYPAQPMYPTQPTYPAQSAYSPYPAQQSAPQPLAHPYYAQPVGYAPQPYSAAPQPFVQTAPAMPVTMPNAMPATMPAAMPVVMPIDPRRVWRTWRRKVVNRVMGLTLAYEGMMLLGAMVAIIIVGVITASDLSGVQWDGIISLISVFVAFGFLLLMRHRDIFTCEFWLGGQHRDSYGEPNQLGHISQYGGGRMQPLWALMFIVLGMGVQGIVMLVQVAFSRLGTDLASPTSDSIAESSVTVSMWLYVGLVAPFCEEVLFRGVLMKELKPLGKNFAIVTSAMVFGLFHDDVVQGTFAFLFGLILGFVAMEYSLVWSIALHIFNNAILSGAIDTLAGNYLDDNAYLIFSLSLSVIGVIGSIIIFVIYGKEMRQYHRTNRSIPDTYFGWAAPTFIIFVVANAAFAIISFVGAMMG